MKKLLLIGSIFFSMTASAISQVVIVPVDAPPPTLTSVTVNSESGDQFDPHVSGDWMVYTSEVSLRYYKFSTNIDAEIPRGQSNLDLLSDISGSKIVFARVFSGSRTAVMVFDAATPLVDPVEIDSAPGTTRLGSAIGGNTVAYIDFGLHPNGELVVHDLISMASERLTNDVNIDGNPQVSPDGNVVVWEQCNTSFTNCDIWKAVKTAGVWNVGVSSASPGPDANPDTNGTLVVNDSRFPTPMGVFRSMDNGTGWTAVNSGLTYTDVTSLAVSGSNLFAGTFSGGVFRSADNGTTWTSATTGITDLNIRSLAVSGSTVFAGTQGGGIFRSSDNGANWIAVNNGFTINAVLTLAVSGSNIFAGSYGAAVFLSTDNGDSWTQVTNGVTNPFVTALAVSGSNLFASTSGGGVFRSTDSGTNWTAVNTGLGDLSPTALTASGSNLFAGTGANGVFLSTNNGASWTAASTGLPAGPLSTLMASGSNVFAGTYGSGAFLSTDNGTSWTAINNGLIDASVRAFALSGPNLFVGSSAGEATDLYWRSVGGGTETHLQIAGVQINPSIAGNYIAFEGRAAIFDTSDLFVYNVVSNLLYRITDTPLVSEQLNDITMLPNCDVRVVWASDEVDYVHRNIKAATFSVGGCGGPDTTPPVLDEPIPNVVVSLPLNSSATTMAVTFATPTATDNSGSVTVVTNPVSGSVFPVGTTTVNVTATDGAGNTDTGSFTVTVLLNFSGFLQPVDELPMVNLVSAGQAVPVKFSLSGDKGLNIFAASYPVSSPVPCNTTEPGSVIEETLSAGGSSLSYNAAADVYSYVWKTDKAWKGTCRLLVVRLSDGSRHFAKFRFR